MDALPVNMPVLFHHQALETCSRERIREIQWDKLKLLLPAVFWSNRFYRKKWQEAGLKDPGEIRSLEDLRKLPFTTKREIVEDQETNPPFGTNLSLPLERFVRVHETSGTTARPVVWLDTAESWEWWLECWGYVYRGMGIGPGDRLFFAFSFEPFIGFWAGFEAARLVGAMVISGGGRDHLGRIQAIYESAATVLVSTPSYALRLAGIARENGIINLADCSIKKVIAAGEPGASVANVKQRIEALWGARCYDHTGLTEVGATGFECVMQNGGVHLIESEFIFEVIDPETGREVEEGEDGELVATNLGRYGMPVFRYRTGDRVRLNSSRCPCGRSFARLEGGIIGRVDDMFIVGGKKLFPSALQDVISGFGQVRDFLIEVHGPQEDSSLYLLLEMELGLHSPEAVSSILQAVQREVQRRLSIPVEARAVPIGALPSYGLKGKKVVRVGN